MEEQDNNSNQNVFLYLFYQFKPKKVKQQAFDIDHDYYFEDQDTFDKSQSKVKHQMIDRQFLKMEQNQLRDIPTFEEVQQCFRSLRLQLPKPECDKILDQIYKNVCQKIGGRSAVKVEYNPIQPSQLKTLDFIPKNGGITRTFQQGEGVPIFFHSKQQQYRYNQKRIVAKAFCDRQYGIRAVQIEITNSDLLVKVDRIAFKHIVEFLATNILRKIEKFLMTDCNISIKTINRYNTKMMFRVILNCRKMLGPQESDTLIKFARALYGLRRVTISEEEAINCYKGLRKCMRERIKFYYEKELDQCVDSMNIEQKIERREQLRNPGVKLINQIWNDQFQKQLMTVYQKEQEFAKIKMYFLQKYPQHAEAFTPDSLRNRLSKLIREIVKSIYTLYSKHQLQLSAPVKLDQFKARFLFRSLQCQTMRIRLIQFHQNIQNQITDIEKIITEFNACFKQKFPNAKKLELRIKAEKKQKSRRQRTNFIFSLENEIKNEQTQPKYEQQSMQKSVVKQQVEEAQYLYFQKEIQQYNKEERRGSNLSIYNIMKDMKNDDDRIYFQSDCKSTKMASNKQKKQTKSTVSNNLLMSSQLQITQNDEYLITSNDLIIIQDDSQIEQQLKKYFQPFTDNANSQIDSWDVDNFGYFANMFP